MPDRTPRSVVQRWFDEVWNQGKEATIDELFAPEGVGHGLGEGEVDVHGPADFKSFWRNIRAALPDAQIHVQDIVVEGDRVAARVILQGTHSGDGLGSKATGRPVRIAGIVIVRIVDGWMVEAWNSWDQLGLLQQLGVLGRAAEPDRFLKTRS
jgi:steroid delta-isomerase-like uncharacterized protein